MRKAFAAEARGNHSLDNADEFLACPVSAPQGTSREATASFSSAIQAGIIWSSSKENNPYHLKGERT
jgi:hypothetical protein